MLQINNKTLLHDGGAVKSLEGTYNDGKIKLNKANRSVYIGGLRFPVTPINRLSLVEDGRIAFVDSRLCVSIDLEWWTLEIITLETKQNLGLDQQVTFIIKYGETSTVMTNLSDSGYVFLPYQPTADLSVTALNFANGAVQTVTAIPAAGQGYTITAVSTDEQVGEEQITGGELITTGELKTVCVATGWNKDTAPRSGWNGTFTINYVAAQFQNADGPTVRETYKNLMDDVKFFGTAPGAGGFKEYQEQPRLYNLINKGAGLYRQSDGFIIPFTSNPNEVYYINETYAGSYKIVLLGNATSSRTDTEYEQTVLVDGIIRMTGFTVAEQLSTPTIILEAGKAYMFNCQISSQGISINPLPINNTGSVFIGSIQFQSDVTVGFSMIGPMDFGCLQEQQIDTRSSYVTPVVRTDTRRTLHHIDVTLTPLN
jgi:hypothetical protein